MPGGEIFVRPPRHEALDGVNRRRGGAPALLPCPRGDRLAECRYESRSWAVVLAVITAAFELTATPELRQQYEVTVHQRGWRLGGKGASGRNREHGQRIEEHGLHMWMGFYDKAFDVMRRCYREWRKAPDNPFQDWTDAFKPQPQITLQERAADAWVTWDIACPTLPGQPGDGHRLTLPELAVAAFEWLIANLGKGSHPAHQQARQR